MKDKILIIDDSEDVCSMLTLQLQDDFDVFTANDGLKGIDLFTQHEFLIVLLDVEMPGMDGFEVCEKLGQIEVFEKPSFIFISSHDDEETTLRCFEVGADDFISKNNETTVLTKKLKSLVRYKRLINNLHQEEENLTNLVNTTLLQASFYGSCLNLMADIQLALTEDAIADLVFNFMKGQGLLTAMSFSHGERVNYFDQQHKLCSPIEKKVFTLLKDKGRIYEFADRMMFNDSHFSLLIKHMPANETNEYGLLIDVLAKLVPAIEMRYRALINAKQLETAKDSLQQAVGQIQDAIVGLQVERQKIIDDIVMKIGLSFHEMDFTGEQEDFLVNLIETSVVQQSDNNDKFMSINQQLNQTIESIKPEEDVPFAQEDASSDIELF